MRTSNLFVAGTISAIIGWIVILVFSPVLTFGFAYIGGMLLDYIVGARLVEGLNLIFDTSRFTRDLIPLVCATLATIGRYFKSHLSYTNKSK